MNICFLGDTQVGKTTFFAALHRTKSSTRRFVARFEDEHRTGYFLDELAVAIEDGRAAAATSTTSFLQGRLERDCDLSIDIVFCDIPGEHFQSGYSKADERGIESMRDFINTCSYFYFFIDLESVENDRKRGTRTVYNPIKTLFADYYKNNTHAPSLCIALTKVDKYKKYQGDSGVENFKTQISEYYQEDMDFIRRNTSELTITCISSYCDDDNKTLGISEDRFDALFDPLVVVENRINADLNRKRRIKIFWYAMSLLLLTMILIIAGFVLYECERDRVHRSGASLTGWGENYNNQKIYVHNQIKQLKSIQINDENLERTKKQYDDLAKRWHQFDVHIQNEWRSVIKPYQESLSRRIKDLIQDLRAHPNQSKWDLYDSLCLLYTHNIHSKLPPELILDRYAILMKGRIDGILKILYRGTPRVYVQSRVGALRDFVALKPESRPSVFSRDQLSELHRALELAEQLCVKRKYSVVVHSRKLSNQRDLFYKLQVGPDDAPSAEIRTKVYENTYGATTDSLNFMWNIDQRLKVTLMTDGMMGEKVAADIWRDSNDEDIALSLFTEKDWMKNSYAFNNAFASNVEFHFRLRDSKGVDVSPKDIELVKKYILTNQFWNELLKKLSSS